MIKNVVIYGKGDFASLMYHYLRYYSLYKVVAFCVDEQYLDNDTFCGLPLISFNNIDILYPALEYSVFVVVGYSNMRARKVMYKKIKNKKYDCINYISPKSIIDKSVLIGENNIILENSVIEPFTVIGDNNVIWSSSNICHNVIIKSHSFISSKSLIGGFSTIKDNCFLGFNSTVLQDVVLEGETLVGAKSLILKSTEPFSKYVGSPAEKISSHKEGGISIK